MADRKRAAWLNIDPRGKFLLAVGMQSASMTSYAIGADGALKQLKQYPMGTQPNWIEIVDLPKPV
jgi:6-phosphogluconolactonase